MTPLRVGDILKGFCAGHFGRDSYSDKRVEAIGADWVVTRDQHGLVEFAACAPEDLVEFRKS